MVNTAELIDSEDTRAIITKIQERLYKRDKKQAKSGVERSFEAVLLSLVNLKDVM